MHTCIFCEIINQQAAASIVYEDETTLAFMNSRQGNAGHVLVIPKLHVATFDQLDFALASDLSQTVLKLAKHIQAVLQPDGLNIWQSNGVSAGQEVPHVHIHLLPRKTDDQLLQFYQHTPPHESRATLDALAARLRIKP